MQLHTSFPALELQCSAKASHIFSTKTIGIYKILMFEILAKRSLTTSLVLNNRAQMWNPIYYSALAYIESHDGWGTRKRVSILWRTLFFKNISPYVFMTVI